MVDQARTTVYVQVGNKRFARQHVDEGFKRVFDEQTKEQIEEFIYEDPSVGREFKKVATLLAMRLAGDLEASGERELLKVVPFITDKMLNIRSPIDDPQGVTRIGPQRFMNNLGKDPIGSVPTLGTMIDRDGSLKPTSTTMEAMSARSLDWPNLRSIRRKRYEMFKEGISGSPEKFFVRSGKLKKRIGMKTRNIPDRIGGVKAEFVRRQNSYDEISKFSDYIGQINLTVAPRVTQTQLPALGYKGIFDPGAVDWTMHNPKQVPYSTKSPPLGFERTKVGLSGSYLQKLYGPSHPPDIAASAYRPLFVPVTQFWLFFRVPYALRKTLTRSFKRYTTQPGRMWDPRANI